MNDSSGQGGAPPPGSLPPPAAPELAGGSPTAPNAPPPAGPAGPHGPPGPPAGFGAPGGPPPLQPYGPPPGPYGAPPGYGPPGYGPPGYGPPGYGPPGYGPAYGYQGYRPPAGGGGSNVALIIGLVIGGLVITGGVAGFISMRAKRNYSSYDYNSSYKSDYHYAKPTSITGAPGAKGAMISCTGELCPYDLQADSPKLRFKVDGDEGTRVSIGGQSVTVGASAVDLTVDVSDKLRAMNVTDFSTYGSDKIVLAVEVESAEHVKTNSKMELSVQPLLKSMFEQVEKGPVAFTGDGAAPSKTRGLVSESKVFGTSKTVGEIDLVAITKPGETRAVGPCGPYNAYGGAGGDFADHNVYDADVIVYNRYTGKVVTKRHFPGVVTECPWSVTSYNGVISAISDGPSDEQIEAWLKTQAH